MRETVHGPVISDVIDSVAAMGQHPVVAGKAERAEYAVSLAWTGLVPSATADAIFALDAATTFAEFREAARHFAVPSQNLLYADTAGHIGYQSPGLIPIRSAATPGAPAGYWPAPGWDSQYDWRGWVPFEMCIRDSGWAGGWCRCGTPTSYATRPVMSSGCSPPCAARRTTGRPGWSRDRTWGLTPG